MPWQNERSAKLLILKTSQALFSKELTEPEFQFWTTVLDEHSVAALRYAFENWNRNGRYFPKPKDIIELMDAYKMSKAQYGHPTCDDLCKSRHFKGYGTEDMVWLFDRYFAKRKALGNRVLNESEVGALMDELDVRRGKPPVWRAE
jgi:hypothetical protein